MVDTKQKITEIKALLEEVYAETRGLTADERTKRNELRTAIDSLDLSEIENLADLTFQEKTSLLATIADLNQQIKAKETELDQANQALATQKTQVADKITADLVSKLGNLANGKLEFKRIPKKVAKKDTDGKEVKDADGKTVYEDAKDSNGNIIYEEVVDLSELKSALNEIKAKENKLDTEELAKKLKSEQPTNYWGIAGVIFSGLSLLGISFLAFKNSKDKEKEK